MKTSFSPLTVAFAALLTWQTTVCRPARADDTSSPPDVPPVWLGDPGMDIAKARARVRERYEAAVHWDIDHKLAAYEAVGRKDSRWDDDVRETLRNSANYRSDQPGGASARRAEQAACARALAHGCDDPLIIYLGLRTGNSPPETSADDLARLYTEAERNLDRSGYPPLLKYFAAVRAAQQDVERRRTADGSVSEPRPGETQPAAGWAAGTDVSAAFRHGLVQWKTLFQDPTVPAVLYYPLTIEFLEAASADPIGRAEVLRPLEKFFVRGESTGQTPAVAKLFEGRFWLVDAWDARTDFDDDGALTDKQKKRFFGRVGQALAALKTAWELDPTEPETACALIRASCDHDRPRAEVDLWFRRAMDARPDDYKAAQEYTRYPGLYWNHTTPSLLEFGRQCLATHDAQSRLPMIILSVHKWLADQSKRPAAYWRRPEVWADLRDLFERMTKARPDEPVYAQNYAVCAWRARDWPLAHAQFELVGDRPDPCELDSLGLTVQQYQEMRREAADRAGNTQSDAAGSRRLQIAATPLPAGR